MKSSKAKTEPNDAAFPKLPTSQTPAQVGLTKREYFAACVMQGLVASEWCEVPKMGKEAVQIADALIAALNSENRNDLRTKRE